MWFQNFSELSLYHCNWGNTTHKKIYTKSPFSKQAGINVCKLTYLRIRQTPILSFKLYHAIKLRFHFSLIRTNAKSIWTNAQSCKRFHYKIAFSLIWTNAQSCKRTHYKIAFSLIWTNAQSCKRFHYIKLRFYRFGHLFNPVKGSNIWHAWMSCTRKNDHNFDYSTISI